TVRNVGRRHPIPAGRQLGPEPQSLGSWFEPKKALETGVDEGAGDVWSERSAAPRQPPQRVVVIAVTELPRNRMRGRRVRHIGEQRAGPQSLESQVRPVTQRGRMSDPRAEDRPDAPHQPK